MAAPVMAAAPAVLLDLNISCLGLRKADVTSKSDPLAVVYMRRTPMEDWTEVGRTEWIKNNQNPTFSRAVRIPYTFEVTQFLRFVVYDADDERGKVSKSDFLGDAETTLASICASPGGSLTLRLAYPRDTKVDAGNISIVAQEVRESNYEAIFEMGGRCLDKKDVFGKSDPYLVIKQRVGQGLVAVYESETVMNTLDPLWKRVTINLQKLCGCDMQRPLVFECYDWDKHGSHDLIGAAETTMGQLMAMAAQGPPQLPLINPKKQGKRGYNNSGTLFFSMARLIPIPTFLDYIRGGCEMNMIVAVDFTASNGLPSNAHSLHHINPSNPNQYELAIQSVGSILSYYDRDGMIPVYGYGGSLSNGRVSHCFPLNGNESNPEVPGVQGILDAYHSAIQTYGLSGPTYFSEIINRTRDIVEKSIKDPRVQKYFVLLILTDGCINDMAQTVKEIVKASKSLPLSIVIVGVGSSPELKKMEELDADDQVLTDKDGKKAARDIVQFVPFAKYAACPPKLAEETLAEIPKQLVSYMRINEIPPLVPPMPMTTMPAMVPMAAPM